MQVRTADSILRMGAALHTGARGCGGDYAVHGRKDGIVLPSGRVESSDAESIQQGKWRNSCRLWMRRALAAHEAKNGHPCNIPFARDWQEGLEDHRPVKS